MTLLPNDDLDPNLVSVVTPAAVSEERAQETTLRPKLLDEYVGQEKVVGKLRVFITACRQRGEALDHCLFCGPPGLGKTTLAGILANELGVPLRATSGPALEKSGDLAAILTNLEEHAILFIDEIHRLNRAVEEMLYLAMEDFKLDIIIGEGPSARTIKLDLPRFTLVGATTRTGLLTSPLRDRFGVVERLDYYSESDLTRIAKRSANILSISIADPAAVELSRRSRGTPRIANRLLRRMRDFAQVAGKPSIDPEIAAEAFRLLEVDQMGFDWMDQKILKTIIDVFDGGPVGLETIAAAVGEESQTIEEVYEPYLLQKGFLTRTPRGRMATGRAYTHLGKSLPAVLRDDLNGVVPAGD